MRRVLAGVITAAVVVAGAWTASEPVKASPAPPQTTPTSPKAAVRPASPVPQVSTPRQSPAPTVAEQRALVTRYCAGCHNDRTKSGGLSLDGLDLSTVGAHADVWEKVVRKLRGGVMPPVGRPRPDPAAYEGLVSWLETQLDLAAAASPNAGRTEALHRLNRAEYKNVVRDLLALDVDIASLLPADDASFGFDNIASALKVNQSLMEQYVTAARKISRLAVGGAPPAPAAETFRVPSTLSQRDQIDGLPFGTRGGTLINYTFPVDAEYVVRVEYTGGAKSATPHELEVSLDGERVKLLVLERKRPAAQTAGIDLRQQEAAKKAQEQDAAKKAEEAAPDASAEAPATPKGPVDLRKLRAAQDLAMPDFDYMSSGPGLEMRLPIKAGPRSVAVTFVRKPVMAVDGQMRIPFVKPRGGDGDGGGSIEPVIRSVTITGPFNITGPGDTPSRRRVFVCRPSAATQEPVCAHQILTTLARKAYRRPVTDADVQLLLGFYKEGRKQGGFDAGIEAAIQRLLVSPQFLFRFEPDPTPTAAPGITPVSAVSPARNYRLTDLELASRLSFFLWSSIPDDELLDVAIRGRLKDPAVLDRQVRRMVADKRAEALLTNFVGQWLQLRNLEASIPDEFIFPDFDDSLRRALRRETELFFESIMRDDRSVLDVLTGDYTFVNERLAKHYGIPNVFGTHFRKVSLADIPRRGVLGQGSILLVTSRPNRTSPVLRGKWIMENILGTPPPEPPPNVPVLPERSGVERVLTMRERMAEHRANAVCAACHNVIDPLGFALEHFDAVGGWRDLDAGYKPIDEAGTLPDGTKFDSGAAFLDALVKHPEPFVNTVTERLLTYALGRGLAYYDRPAVRKIVRDSAPGKYRFSSLILGIAKSLPFQMRRAEAPSTPRQSVSR
jgi:mono/diheme cytochrome c family protein